MRVVFVLSFILLTIVTIGMANGCGSNASGGGSSPGGISGTIYVGVWNSITNTSEIISLNAGGGNVKHIVSFESGSTLESFVLPYDNSAVLYQYSKANVSYWGYYLVSGGSDHPIWKRDSYCASYLNHENYADPPFTYYIVHVSSEGGGTYGIYEEGNGGTFKIKSGANKASYPVFSYDGVYIADSKSEWVTAYNGSGKTADISSFITGESHYPSFSPATSEILAYVFNDSTFIYDVSHDYDYIAATTEIAGILRSSAPYPPAHPEVDTSHPFINIKPPLIWSGDGNYLYFTAMPTDEATTYVYRLGMYSGVLTKLTPDTSGTTAYDNLYKFNGINKLFYVMIDAATMNLCSMNMDGSGKTTLLSSTDKLYFFDRNNLAY